ncbi:MAG: autotransporter-associated beta strand repeat-containing protein [Kiritimatiellia bacterium]
MKKTLAISSAKLHAVIIATIVLASPVAHAAVAYKWTGETDGDWQTAANWDPANGKPPSGGASTSGDSLSVENGSNHPLIYTEAEGQTLLNVFKINNGELTINGGTLILTNSNSTVSSIGNFHGGGKLNVNGGLLRFELWDTLYINENGPSNCVLTITGGTISFFRMSLRGGTRGGSATFNLDGGLVELTQPIPLHGTGNNAFNFNGGTLKATTYNWPYSTNDNANYAFNASPANVRNGGAFIDTNGRTCHIQAGLCHSPVADDAAIDGGLTKNGAGALILMGANTYTGATTVNAGTLTYAAGGEMHFALQGDFTCNTIQGTGAVNFNGLFRINPPSGPSVYGDWQLVDVASLTETFHATTFGLALADGAAFTQKGDGTYTSGGWKFNTATGTLTHTPLGTLVTIR